MAGSEPYHHGALRQTLLALAREHIAAQGVDSLSVRALAREAGVAHRAAYQHFPDKEGLIAATLAEAFDRLAAQCDIAAAHAKSPESRLENVALAYAAFAFAEPNMFLAMTGPRINQSGRYADLEMAIAKAWRQIAGPIGVGVDSGVFTLADKRAAAAIFWGGLQGVLAQALLNRLKLKSAEREAFMTTVAKRLIAGLKAKP